MTSANTNSVLYDAGYNDAFNRRPAANEDTDYLDGYKDGTLLYERKDGVGTDVAYRFSNILPGLGRIN